MTAISVTCPTCLALEGNTCTTPPALDTQYFHQSRVDQAAFSESNPLTDEARRKAIDAVVDEMGLT